MYRHAHSWLDGPSEPGPTLEDCQELTDKHLRVESTLSSKKSQQQSSLSTQLRRGSVVTYFGLVDVADMQA
jgi:hypothetical protein